MAERTTGTWAGAAAVMLWGAGAVAQLVLPPSPPPPPTPEYVPPRPPSPTPTPEARRNAAGAFRPELSTPYESLVKRDANGRLIRLTEPEMVAALRVNPLIDDVTMAHVHEYLVWRAARTERLVVENLDIYNEVRAGAIDRIDFSSKGDPKGAFQKVKNLTLPLTVGEVQDDLKKRGILTPGQTALLQKIAGEYQTALLSEMRADILASDSSDDARRTASARVPRQVYNDRVRDAHAAYRRLLLAAAPDAPALCASVGAPESATPLAKAAAAASTDDARFDAMAALMDALPLEGQRALLRKVLDGRPMPPEPATIVTPEEPDAQPQK